MEIFFMKRFIFLGLLVFSLAGLGIMSGCSDDDNPTGSQTGDTTSAKFQFIDSTIAEDVFDGFGQSVEISFGLLASHLGVDLSGSKGTPGLSLQDDGSQVVVNSISSFEFTNDSWWVFIFDADVIDGDDTTNITGTDSVQILLGGVPLAQNEYNDEADFDGAKARAHVNGQANDDLLGAHHRIDVELDVIGGDTVLVVNGTTRDTLEFTEDDGQAECDVFLSQGLTLNNLTLMDGDFDDCMLDGSITASVTIDLSCTGSGDDPGPLQQLDIEGTWTITAVINDNQTATITFTDGTTTWRVTEEIDCTTPG